MASFLFIGLPEKEAFPGDSGPLQLSNLIKDSAYRL
jgi:hypothetical protein